MNNRVISSSFIVIALLSAMIFPSQTLAHDFVVDGLAYNIEDGHAVVTYKGYYSSNSYSLLEVVIPTEVTYNEVTYPVTAIGNYAFNNSSLTGITIPSTITEIRTGAFYKCRNLDELNIPESVNSIGDYAFQGSSLRSLHLSCHLIGKDALKELSSLENITGPDASEDGKCLIIDGSLRLFAPVGVAEYTIPPVVKTIESNVFYNNNTIESLTLPSGLETIRSYGIYSCQSLKRINIPASVKLIESTFQCSSLTEALIEDIDSYCHLGSNISYGANLFNGSKIVELLDYNGNPIYDITFPGDVKKLWRNLFAKTGIHTIKISEGVDEIDNLALSGCKNLTLASIPSSVVKIGNEAFSGCIRLTDFIYGATDAVAGYHVKEDREDEHAYIFTDCPSLTHVEMTDDVAKIPEYLFAQTCIKSIAFPTNVESIGSAVFYLGNLEEALFEGTPQTENVFFGCSALRKVTMLSPTPPTCLSDLSYVSNASLYVPEGAIDSYLSASGWSRFKTILSEPPAGVAGHIFESGNLRFEITDSEEHLCKVTSPSPGKDYYGEIIIPSSVTADNGDVYSVTAVDDLAFTHTSKMTSLRIPATLSAVSGIDNTAAGLRSIIVDEDNQWFRSVDGVLFDKNVHDLLLYPAAKPGPYTVPATVENVGSNLAAKINLDELTISDSVKGWLGMSNSPSLRYLKMGSGITSFSVANCGALEYLEIGSGVKEVKGENFGAGYHDIWNTTNIKKLIIADSPDPIKIYTMSVDDGYLSAIPTSSCQYLYIGRNLEATGSPLWSHFSNPVKHVEFGPEVTRLDTQTLNSLRYGVNKVSVPSADYWASIPRGYYPSLNGYSLSIDGVDVPDILLTSERVDQYAFNGVNNIKTITLSDDVRTLEQSSLNAPNLESLIVKHHSPENITVNGSPVYYCDAVTLHVPAGTKHLYSNSEYWRNFNNIVEQTTNGFEDLDIPSEAPDVHPTATQWYDLSGRRLTTRPTAPGIYIERRGTASAKVIIR